MTKHDDQARAAAFMDTWRGKYIISQALTVAINAMSDVPSPHQEKSNIEDMRVLRDNLFPLYAEIHGEDWLTPYDMLLTRVAITDPDILVDPLGMEPTDE